MVRALQYLTFARPNLAFNVHRLCEFMHTPTTTHLEATKRVLRYIRGTFINGIHFPPSLLTLSTFTDADWAREPSDRNSTTGFFVFLGSNPISWSSKKQTTVARSTKAEYHALATTTAELAWLRILFKELRSFLSHVPILWCDNVSTIALASNLVFHARRKHIEVDFDYIHEKVICRDFVSDSSLGKIILQISSPNLCLHQCFCYLEENLWWFHPPFV